MTADWSIDRARQLYATRAWGHPYFDISNDGELLVRPRGEGPGLPLPALLRDTRDNGLRLPLLLRFPEIIEHRARRLLAAFDAALAQRDLDSEFQLAYPIKVNQQRTVVDTLAAMPRVGLEAGSKPELIAVLARARPGSRIICNGYKDAGYVRLALMGQQLGHEVIVVLEKPGELERVRREAQRLGVTPCLGVRLRLSSLGTGNWQNTGGERAKFGLSAPQLMSLMQSLTEHGELDWLQLVHFHMGSQISNLRDIRRGVQEAARYLVELCRTGAPIRILDVGGGLGVDYEGSRSRAYCSINYTVEQYAETIVETVASQLEDAGLPMPDLVSESGRALTAHHAVLVADITAADAMPVAAPARQDNDPAVLRELHQLLGQLDELPAAEGVLEAQHLLDEGKQQFLDGRLDLGARERLERLYFACLERLQASLAQAAAEGAVADAELQEQLSNKLADKYFLNLSIFQSLPDIWALDQVFPIMPIHGLDQAPGRAAVIEDLTCDSDGRIDRYVSGERLSGTLPVPSLSQRPDLCLALFLTGAYQETLGDIHNLFGDTDSVDVLQEDDDKLRLNNPRQGDNASHLLELVGYSRESLNRALDRKAEQAGIDAAARAELKAQLKQGLDAYTYLETGP